MTTQAEDASKTLMAYGSDIYDINTIAQEIIAYTGNSELEIWKRLALELNQTGTNVMAEIKRFDVTPHVFNDNLVRFYRESDGFIFETCIESRNSYRIGKWLKIAEFVAKTAKAPRECDVLLYGDSVGNDSIFMSRMGFNVFYHDYDGYCSRFAKKRFKDRDLRVHSFEPGTLREFDFVICFEVAEHVPSPPDLIEELAALTAADGYCIFSESFGLIKPQFPTHLVASTKYVGKADEMFGVHGMRVAWRDPDNKPIVYTKLPESRSDRAARRARTVKHVGRRVKSLFRRRSS